MVRSLADRTFQLRPAEPAEAAEEEVSAGSAAALANGATVRGLQRIFFCKRFQVESALFLIRWLRALPPGGQPPATSSFSKLERGLQSSSRTLAPGKFAIKRGLLHAAAAAAAGILLLSKE